MLVRPLLILTPAISPCSTACVQVCKAPGERHAAWIELRLDVPTVVGTSNRHPPMPAAK